MNIYVEWALFIGVFSARFILKLWAFSPTCKKKTPKCCLFTEQKMWGAWSYVQGPWKLTDIQFSQSHAPGVRKACAGRGASASGVCMIWSRLTIYNCLKFTIRIFKWRLKWTNAMTSPTCFKINICVSWKWVWDRLRTIFSNPGPLGCKVVSKPNL